MQRPQSQQFVKLKDHQKYTIESSDVIEDLRVYVKDEDLDRIFWYKERFLTDDEIVENVVENATSRIFWTIHRPKRGWYIKIRAPSFPPGVAIPLTPLPASSPFHMDAALSVSTRVNSPKPKRGRILSPPPGATASASSSSANAKAVSTTYSSKSSIETTTTNSETVIHSYPPTPSPGANRTLGKPPSPDAVHAMLDQLSTAPHVGDGDRQANKKTPEVRQFLLAPHSSPYVPQPEKSVSLISRALAVLKNHKPSHSLSFTICPLPSLENDRNDSLSGAPSTSGSDATQQQQSRDDNRHSRHHSLVRIEELIPPALPPLLTFHDRSPAWSLGSFTGLLEIDTAMEREFGLDRSFWVTLALAYVEFLVERESYLAAAGGD